MFVQLFRRQSCDQFGFSFYISIEDILLCAEVAIAHHQEVQLHLYMLSMDMRNVCDMIIHPAVLQAF